MARPSSESGHCLGELTGQAVAGPVTDCDVWWVDLPDAPDWCEELFDASERDRASTFRRATPRRRFAVATALLKIVTSTALGCDGADVELRRTCPDCHRAHGRPEVVGGTPQVSISHAADRVAVALCADRPVGVDVEQVDPALDVDGMSGLVLGETERRYLGEIRDRRARIRALFRSWTRKESLLKATGDGLRVPMSTVTLSERAGRPRLTRFAGRPELVGMAQIVDLRPGPGYVGALTVLSDRPVLVRERDGAAAFGAARARHAGRGSAVSKMPVSWAPTRLPDPRRDRRVDE